MLSISSRDSRSVRFISSPPATSADQHHHTHRGQHQVLPALHGEPPTGRRIGRGCVIGLSAPRGPPRCRRSGRRVHRRVSQASSMSASTNSGPGRAACERANSSNPSSPRRSLPLARMPLEESVGEQHQARALGPFHLVIFPFAGSSGQAPGRRAARAIPPSRRRAAAFPDALREPRGTGTPRVEWRG